MPTTFASVANNYTSYVTFGRSIGGTSLTVASAVGLPTVTGAQYFRLSVFHATTPVTILKVTGVNPTTGVLTIDGALEMTDAAVIPGDIVMLADTAGLFTELQSAVNNIESGSTALPVLATGSSVARTLQARFSEVYNVLDWGATGNGTTDDAPAINALIAHVLAQSTYTPRTIYFPAGNYAIHSRLVVAKAIGVGTPTPSIRLLGDGPSSQITATSAMTEMIRIEDALNTTYERLSLVCSAAVSLAALHITAITSGQDNIFRSISVDCASNCPVAIGVNLDSEAANTQIQFLSCSVKNATVANILLGDGFTGNACDIQFSGCQATNSQVGVWIDGAPVTWKGGSLANCSVSDFWLSECGKGPIILEGFTSSNGNCLFRGDKFGEVPPIRISDVHVKGFTGVTYNRSGTTFTPDLTEGFVISYRGTGVLTIISCSFWGGPVTHWGGRLDVNSPCNTVLINCELTVAGGTAGQTAAFNYAYGGKGTGKNYSVIGGRQVTSADTTVDSPIDMWCDGPAYFNDVLAINTTSPTAQYHQRGGSFRMEKIADPVVGPVITSVTSPPNSGSTSYTYWFIFKDQVKNVTKISPSGSTSTGAATLDSSNYNLVQMPVDTSVSYVDILRGDQQHAVAIDWNPYMLTPYFQYKDQSMATSIYGPISARNTTADMILDGAVTAESFNASSSSSDVSASTVLATSSNTARSLAARFFAPFNVLDWGVKGDGVTDDQPAIMALLRYISNVTFITSTPRTVYFPAGTYLIGSASNPNGIMCGRQYLPKADNSLWPVGTGFHSIHFVGESYNTALTSNCPTGISEILRMEDCPQSSITGFRFHVPNGLPVKKAAFHVVPAISAQTFAAEDLTVEIERYLFSINVTNGQASVTAAGSTTWPTNNLVGKYLQVHGDTTMTDYLIDATPTSTSMTLHTTYSGTTGQTSAVIKNDGVPVGIGTSLDYSNDLAQVRYEGCKVTGASYAGFMIGSGIVGNVLDIRFHNCQSLQNPVGVFGFAAPFIWDSSTTTFNYIVDFYHHTAGGPIYMSNARSEGSNLLYVNVSGGTSLAPVTLSNIAFQAWTGRTPAISLTAKLPFVQANVGVTNGSPTVTGINTLWQAPGQFVVGQSLIFDNDSTATAYRIKSIDSQTQITLGSVSATTPYAGPTNANTWCACVGPSFGLQTQLGLDGTSKGPVNVTHGSGVVTGPANWTTGLVANFHYLTFASDTLQTAYGIASVDSGTQVTLGFNSKGYNTYQGLTGITRVICGLVEGFTMIGHSGGIINLFGVSAGQGPTPYGYGRWDFKSANLWVNAVGCSTSTSSATAAQAKDENYAGGGFTPNGTNFCALPGPAMTFDGKGYFKNPLGLWCSTQANFSRQLMVAQFLSQPLYSYHQQGGSMRVQKIPDPVSTPTAAVHGTATTGTSYTYKMVFRDVSGFQTLPTNSTSALTTTQPYTNFSNAFGSGNYNSVSITVTYNTTNPAYIDILRSEDGGSTWYSVVHSTTSGAELMPDGVTYSWNPYVTNTYNASTLTFNDYSTTAPIGPVTLPTRNGTADATFDGYISANGQASPYPGTAGGEVNGAQTIDGTWTSKNQTMLQTVYNLARAYGLLA